MMKLRCFTAVFMLSLIIVAGTLLAACSPATSSTSRRETDITTVPSVPQETTTGVTTTTGGETQPEPPELIDLAEIGRLAEGHTLLVPGGKWYDISAQSHLQNISRMTVTTEGIGKPTLSLPDESAPLLRLENCERIVFRQVRFGYERADYKPGDPALDIPLIEIIDSVSVRFEQCEFFGAGGAAIFLADSENIVFEDCQFYNLAGPPIITDQQSLPSQIYMRNSSLETVFSGPLPLNLRASFWENCTLMSYDSYCYPVATASCYPAASLDRLLAGRLTARISHHADENKQITVRGCLFTSRETYTLFSRLEDEIFQVLPADWSNLALKGQKLEEKEPGRPLDPTLGLALELRTEINNNPGPGEPVYNTDMMLADLAALEALPPLIEDLINGAVEVYLYDQSRQPLLNISFLPADIIPVLQADPRSDLSRLSRIVLLDEKLIPAQFTGRASGQIIARDSRQNIEQALAADAEPLIIWPENDQGSPCQLELHLSFLGSKITAAAASHEFSLQMHRYLAADQENCHEATTLAKIQIQADTGAKTDMSAAGRRFSYATETEKNALAQALARPLYLESGEKLYLLRTEEEIDWARTPVLVYKSEEQEIELKLLLYDQDIRPQPLILTLRPDDNAEWQIEAAELLD